MAEIIRCDGCGKERPSKGSFGQRMQDWFYIRHITGTRAKPKEEYWAPPGGSVESTNYIACSWKCVRIIAKAEETRAESA